MSIFQIVSLIVAGICILKAVTALLFQQAFYQWRGGQYASASVPKIVLVMPTLVMVLMLVVWYATLTAYVPYGWILTIFLTFIGMMGVLSLLRWSNQHRKVERMVKSRQATTAADTLVFVIGVVFLVLGVWVY